MKKIEIRVPRKYLTPGMITVVVLTGLILSLNEFFPSETERAQSIIEATITPAPGSAQKFALLSGQAGQRSVGST